MKIFKMVTAFVVLALVLTLTAGVFAQEDTFGLSTEDFAALVAANAASTAATAAAFDFTMTGSVAGIPDMGSASLSLSGSGAYDIAGQVFDLTVTGSLSGGGQELPVNFAARVVDNTIFINLDGSAWLGITGEDFEMFVEDFDMGAPVDLGALAGGDANFAEAAAALAAVDPTEFVGISRAGDTFSINFDIAGFMASEQLQNTIMAAAALDATEEMSEGEIAAMSALVGVLFQNSSLTFDQTLNAEGLVGSAVLDLALDIDPAAIGEEGDPIVIDFNFTVNLSDYNVAPTVVAPEGATMLGE